MSRLVLLVLALLATMGGGRVDAQLLNEFAPNPPGTEPAGATTMIELLGVPGASFSGVILAIESDTESTSLGAVNDLFDGLSGTFDSNGLLAFEVDDLENPSFTLVLAEGFSGDASTDFDSDNDGSIDMVALSLFTNVLDAINVPDSTADSPATGGLPVVTFGSDLSGIDLPFIGDEPQLVFRDSVTQALLLLDDTGPGTGTLFDATGADTGLTFTDGFNTFGAVNPTITGGAGQPGDIDGDGDVDVLDYLALRDAPGGPVASDFEAFVDNFGAGVSPAVGPAPIPEPATLAGMLIASAASGLLHRRR